MRNRNIKVQIWLNKREAETLQKKAKRSRISVAGYIRHLIDGVIPQDAAKFASTERPVRMNGVGSSVEAV